ncbi:hypothetical protein ACFZBU_46660 [Embleya sp. NPDC008237]|uniref:hypothetical protein n=1 Tax=Embleya sp. NPDC008237 TaxID=3363978 RepID=UPI0036EC3C7C
MDDSSDHSDYSAPQVRESRPLLAVAEADDSGNDTDDASSPGKYNARSDDELWGPPSGR